MKKRTLLIALAAIVTITACIKEKKNITPATTDDDDNNDTPVVVQPIDTSKPQPPAKTIKITGVEDIHVGLYGSRLLNMQVECDSCFGEQISLDVTGAPNNVEMNFSTTKGPVGFTTTLSTKSRFGKSGTYPIQIVATSEKGKKSTYDVNMIIDEVDKKKCNEFFFWSIFHPGDATYTLKSKNGVTIDTVITIKSFAGGITINHFEPNLYFSFIAKAVTASSNSYNLLTAALYNFDCETAKSTIPSQIIQGRYNGWPVHDKYFTIQGQGQLNIPNNTYDITYTSTYNDSGSTVTENYLVEFTLREL